MEIVIVGIILLWLFNYIGTISFNTFVEDNKLLFGKLKEEDYFFFLEAKYGDKVNKEAKYNSRVKTAIFVFIAGMLFMITDPSMLLFVLVLAASYGVFKMEYFSVRRYYKEHLHDINLKLPYFLKSLEILIQHYTIPVAITKSIDTAPEMFKPGLLELITAIDSGDSTIEPYMAFARRYPVRDSMRMMRLLYRLGLGNQERKQEQLITFSRTVSNLQAKSRDLKYSDRLNKMEKKTMTMLTATGASVMLILLLSILQIFSGL